MQCDLCYHHWSSEITFLFSQLKFISVSPLCFSRFSFSPWRCCARIPVRCIDFSQLMKLKRQHIVCGVAYGDEFCLRVHDTGFRGELLWGGLNHFPLSNIVCAHLYTHLYTHTHKQTDMLSHHTNMHAPLFSFFLSFFLPFFLVATRFVRLQNVSQKRDLLRTVA